MDEERKKSLEKLESMSERHRLSMRRNNNPKSQRGEFSDAPVSFTFNSMNRFNGREHYPKLYAKASQRSIYQSPDFTVEELEERSRLIEFLNRYKNLLDYYSHVDIDTRSDAINEIMSLLPHTDFHALLFMLARCGDETAFLELLSRDTDLMSHPFFLRSLKRWTANARQGDRAAKMILKEMVEIISQSVLASASVQGRGRPRSETPARRCARFIELVEENPDMKASDIYRKIAGEESEGDDISIRDKIRLKGAIKQTIQRAKLHGIVRGLVPPHWEYKHLRKEY